MSTASASAGAAFSSTQPAKGLCEDEPKTEESADVADEQDIEMDDILPDKEEDDKQHRHSEKREIKGSGEDRSHSISGHYGKSGGNGEDEGEHEEEGSSNDTGDEDMSDGEHGHDVHDRTAFGSGEVPYMNNYSYYYPSYGYPVLPTEHEAYFSQQAAVDPFSYTHTQASQVHRQMEMYHRHQAEVHALNFQMHSNESSRNLPKIYTQYPSINVTRKHRRKGRRMHSRYPRRKRHNIYNTKGKNERSQRAGQKSGAEFVSKDSSSKSYPMEPHKVNTHARITNKILHPKYKTCMCLNMRNGYCRFGINCDYAHSEAELRPFVGFRNYRGDFNEGKGNHAGTSETSTAPTSENETEDNNIVIPDTVGEE